MGKRPCPKCNQYTTPSLTVDVIIEMEWSAGGGIVLIKRKNPPYGWALPGGFVDYGESLEAAAIREAEEETSLHLCDLKQFHAYSDPDRDPRRHAITMVFTAIGRGALAAKDDASEIRLCAYDELPMVKFAFDHAQILKEYLKLCRKNCRT